MDYSQQMLARVEHNLMVKSLPSVYENVNNKQPSRRPLGWIRAMFLTVLHLVAK